MFDPTDNVIELYADPADIDWFGWTDDEPARATLSRPTTARPTDTPANDASHPRPAHALPLDDIATLAELDDRDRGRVIWLAEHRDRGSTRAQPTPTNEPARVLPFPGAR